MKELSLSKDASKGGKEWCIKGQAKSRKLKADSTISKPMAEACQVVSARDSAPFCGVRRTSCQSRPNEAALLSLRRPKQPFGFYGTEISRKF